MQRFQSALEDLVQLVLKAEDVTARPSRPMAWRQGWTQTKPKDMPISFLSYLSYLYFISYFFSGTTWTKFSTFSQRFFSRALSESQRG